MLQLHDFKYETQPRKQQLVFERGIYLAHRRLDAYIVFLFAIDGFYTEVYFDREEEQMGYIRAFTSINELGPYLSQIDLSELGIN